MPKPPICDYEGSNYQQVFWEEGERAYEDAVEAIALRRMLPKGGNRLLELGAGAGRNTPRYRGFEEITLLDYSHTQLEQARARLGDGAHFRYVAADAYNLPFAPAVFDAATMIRTIHHLKEGEVALQQVSQVLAGQSVFILEFANKHNLKAMLRYLLGKQNWNPFTPEQVEFVELNFNFHPRQIRRWLRAAGFSVRQQLTVSHFRVGFLKRHVPLGILKGLDAALQWTGALWQLTPSVFVKNILAQGTPLQEFAFKCPACGHAPLPAVKADITCPQCGKVYKYQDGIYDFRVK
ncbi:MAG: class I SAM-dependent methyltransferase [Chloroflexi bacterium]|nr:class I SAM-dependent methyltransferase [Chloroflexota bacterium]